MEKKFNLNEEMMAKAMKAKNPEELIALAKEHGLDMDEYTCMDCNHKFSG